MLDKSLSSGPEILSIGQLNQSVRTLLEQQIPLIWVRGEISNLTRASSGHLYFTLKDPQAQVRCTLWRNKAQLLGFSPENGQKVEARVLVTLYEAKGDYQLNVEALRQAGQGQLFQQFLQLKAQLEAEGLFRNELKRPLPAYPRHIALITSPQAAALQDVLTTLARRAPYLRLSLYPTPVQGPEAVPQIVQALRQAGADQPDLILLCRGGGSLEDLWSFNAAEVARAIRAVPVPVITGIGHETDFTIADFAADLRAPTPTAAAELACPDTTKLLHHLQVQAQRLQLHLNYRLRHLAQTLDGLASRLPSPARQLQIRQEKLHTLQQALCRNARQSLEKQQLQLAQLQQRLYKARPNLGLQQQTLNQTGLRLRQSQHRFLENRTHQIQQAARSLKQLDPHAVLQRGYAIVFDTAERAIRRADALHPGDPVRLLFHEGSLSATITPVASPEEAS